MDMLPGAPDVDIELSGAIDRYGITTPGLYNGCVEEIYEEKHNNGHWGNQTVSTKINMK